MDVTRMSVDQLPNMLCLVRFGSAYIENGDMRARASSTAHCRFSICYCHHFCSYLMPTCFFASTIVTFCQKWTWAQREKKPNKSEIFNANMVQPNTKSAIVFEEKKQKLCCIRCEMRLKISHITDFVNCLNGGLLVFCASSLTHTLLQPFNDDKYIFTLYDDGKSKPTEKKMSAVFVSVTTEPIHTLTPISIFYWDLSIHSNQSFVFVTGVIGISFSYFHRIHSLPFHITSDISCSLSFEFRILQIVHMKLRTESFCQKIH